MLLGRRCTSHSSVFCQGLRRVYAFTVHCRYMHASRSHENSENDGLIVKAHLPVSVFSNADVDVLFCPHTAGSAAIVVSNADVLSRVAVVSA